MKKALTYSIICFFLVVISGIASVAIYRWCPLCVDELNGMGSAGNAIAGFSAIILGAFGVAATFAAFYIQYIANISLHNDSLKEGFDRKFFELIHLFAQSTNSLQIKVEKGTDFRDKTGNPYEYIQGKNVFQYFHENFISVYKKLTELFNPEFISENAITLICIAFFTIYYGQNDDKSIAALRVLEKAIEESGDTDSMDIAIKKAQLNSFKNNYHFNRDDFFYNEILCHYFKQLYFIAKFLIDSNELSYEQKKLYFSMLRSQLSYNEQLMLFYSWCASIEKELSIEQIKQIFCEYGLIDDVLENELTDNIDIDTIINTHNET